MVHRAALQLYSYLGLDERCSCQGTIKFTTFVRGVSNHHIDDQSLKEYFYKGKDDNNKVMLDTIAGGS